MRSTTTLSHKLFSQDEQYPKEEAPWLNLHNVADEDENNGHLGCIRSDLNREDGIEIKNVPDDQIKRELKPSLELQR